MKNIKIIFKDLIYFDSMLVSLILVWFFRFLTVGMPF